jgi:membrane peptidoglycan carboxypeptidase
MQPALHRRRRQLLTRHPRTVPKRGLTTAFLVLLTLFMLFIGGSALGTAGGLAAAYAYFERDLPEPNMLDDIALPQSSYVYDRTGQTLLARFECENREAVRFDDVPQVIIDATIASEDRSFWENPGIDVQGIGRAFFANLEAGRVVQGASTITQQVIKYAGSIKEAEAAEAAAPGRVVVPEQPIDPTAEPQDPQICEPPELTFLAGRSYEDKIKEAIMAYQVTQAYPGTEGKERILETYLNLIYYGNQSYGIKAAAANYFGLSDLSQMTVAQAAFLAGLPQQPSYLDPFQRAEDCATREERSLPVCTEEENGSAPALAERDLVLGAMLDEGYITRRQYREALATPMPLEEFRRLQSPLLEPHFTYAVRQEAYEILAARGSTDPEEELYTGGYRITTTIDYELQQAAQDLVRKWVTSLVDKNVHNGALIAIDSATGEIVAYVGSVDFTNQDDPRVQGEFDVVGLGRRQPGSAFKPITYSSAFRAREATVATLLVDAITEFGLTPETSYRPTNADITEHGPVLATDALRYSLNIPSVQIQYLAGVQRTAELAAAMGITEDIVGADPGLTLPLGSVPISLYEMTQAYSVFAQQGTLRPSTAILEMRDRNNRIIYTRQDDGPAITQPLTPAEAYLTHWILEGNTDPARNTLWGERARLTDPSGARRQAAFKTGTTDDFRDVSGFGYVPGGLVTGVWMGNNNQEPLSNELGQGLFSADGPLYLWQEFMQRALNEPWEWNNRTPVAQTSFDRPAGVRMEKVCRWTGTQASSTCGKTQEMPFLEDLLPIPDTVTTRGCVDVVQYVRNDTDRPPKWIEAAQIWVQRVATGQTSQLGDPEKEDADPRTTRYKIAPLYGETGFPPICYQRGPSGAPLPPPTPAPTPVPTPTPAP